MMSRRPKTGAPEGFDFVHGGRTFTCSVEPLRSSDPEAWWWFRVSTDDRNRYAPFRVTPTDTQASVQTAIVAYYEDMLARRAAPAPSYWRRGSKPTAAPAAATAATATVATAAAPTAE